MDLMNNRLKVSLVIKGPPEQSVGAMSGMMQHETQELNSQALFDAGEDSNTLGKAKSRSKKNTTGMTGSRGKNSSSSSVPVVTGARARTGVGIGHPPFPTASPPESIDDDYDDDDFAPQPAIRSMKAMPGRGKGTKTRPGERVGLGMIAEEDQVFAIREGAGTTNMTKAQKQSLKDWLSVYRRCYGHAGQSLLNENALVHICQDPPCSMQELIEVEDVGRVKAKKLGEQLLATIWSFLKKNNLLDKFPNMQQPVLDPSPIWTDPNSPAAEELRQKQADDELSARQAREMHVQGLGAGVDMPAPAFRASDGGVGTVSPSAGLASMAGVKRRATSPAGVQNPPPLPLPPLHHQPQPYTGESPSQAWETRHPSHPQRHYNT